MTNQKRICPSCHRKYTEEPALSRKDNRTEICPACGLDEALRWYVEAKESANKKEE